MWEEDPIVNEIREIRKKLEAKFDFDSKLILKDIRSRQQSVGARLIDRKKNKAVDRPVSREGEGVAIHSGR